MEIYLPCIQIIAWRQDGGEIRGHRLIPGPSLRPGSKEKKHLLFIPWEHAEPMRFPPALSASLPPFRDAYNL